jgi:hypothetical protein
MVLERNFHNLPCPKCTRIGGLQLDFATSTFFCAKCGERNLDPWQPQPRDKTKTKEPVTVDARPHIPAGAGIRDVVEDFVRPHDKYGREIVGPSGKSERVLVSRAYCPKTAEEVDEAFDPKTPPAMFYLRLYAKRFKNRRRYDRDIKRRNGGLPSK